MGGGSETGGYDRKKSLRELSELAKIVANEDIGVIKHETEEEIEENFFFFTKFILRSNLNYMITQIPEIKKISEIPELHDLTITRMSQIEPKTPITLHLSTQFTGNVYQLLLDHGCNKEDISVTPKGIVTISLFNGLMQISITKELS